MTSEVSARLREELAPEVLELIFQPRLDAEFAGGFAHMVTANKAHVVMLHGQGILDAATAGALLRALAEIEAAGPAGIVPQARLEDPYFNHEAAVIARVGPDIGGRMHIARSRNDLGAALARMQARDAALAIETLLLALRAALLTQADRYADVVMAGHTHLQPAQPSTYGFYLLGVTDAFARDQARLRDAWPRLNLNPLGAAAMTGSSFAVDRDATTRLLGFDGLIVHTQDAIAARDFGIELLAACVSIALTWSRLAQDVFVMATHEFGTLDLPDRISGTSSIMPQKKNPVVMEHLKARSAAVLAAYVGAATAVRTSHFSMTIDGCREALRPLAEAVREVRDCLRLTRLLVEAAVPETDRMRALAEANFSTATDLADAMVRDHGLSFREAHHVAGGAVRLAMDARLTATGITPALIDTAAVAVLGRPIGMTAAAVARCLDPSQVVQARATEGGPAPASVRARVVEATARLAEEQAELAGRQAGLAEAKAALDAAVAALVS